MSRSIKILIVDDEETIIDIGEELLTRLGYNVIGVNSGEAAVATIQRKSADIDLVLLDIIMPGMDGVRTLDQIRQINRTIPVILCSGYAMDDRIRNIMNRGCNGFIQKPFTLSEISQKIRSIMGASGI